MSASARKKAASNRDERWVNEDLAYHKRLSTITNKIHAARDTNDILLNLQDEILSLFDADRITIYAADYKTNLLVSRFKTGGEISEIRLPISNVSIAGYCAASGKVVNVRDAYDRKELRGFTPEMGFDKRWDEKTGYRTRQVLSAPIHFDGKVLGIIQLINKTNGSSFSQEDESGVLNIGKILGVAFYKNHKIAQKAKPGRFDHLLRNSVISKKDLEKAMVTARKTKRTVDSVLMTDFGVSRDCIARSLSEFYQTRFVGYAPGMVVLPDLVRGMRASFLKNNGFVPIAQSGDNVVVAMEDPNALPARDVLKRMMPGKVFEYCVALRNDIHRIIDHTFSDVRTKMPKDTASIEAILGQLDAHDEVDVHDGDGMSEEDSAIVQLVNKIIVDAYQRGASDIHIEPRQGKDRVLVRFRIDGNCRVYQRIPYAYRRAVVSRIKIMCDLDISERRLPQDGKIKFRKFSPLDIELRVATIPTADQSEDVVMRILAASKPVALENIGMRERDIQAFVDIITKPYGMVLVVGPTGSGKTTTLHAALRHINKPETKIWTAEDPVEITQEGLRQVQVLPKIGLDFARAMRAFLRADPDVIMVGEMRDRETAATAIEASLTGHLVVSTLHTNNASETVTRLLDMGMDPFNFADALLGVLAQRLVRTLCEKCKEKYHPSEEEFSGLVRAYDGDFDALGFPDYKDFVLWRAKGCTQCENTGYLGRTAIHELLVASDEIKSMIQNRATMKEIKDKAMEQGMAVLMQDGIRKVCLGQTDLTQVRKVCMR